MNSGTTDNPFTWIGQSGYYADEETGLYSLRRRGRPKMVALKGVMVSGNRFVSRDPV